jgi:cyanate permease
MTLGWRAAFVIAAGLVGLVAWRVPDASPLRRAEDAPRADAPLTSLIVLAVGVAFGSAAGNTIPAFLVASAVDRGVPVATGGLILAFGSLVGVAVRVAGGWGADRLGRGALRLVAGLLVVGAIGMSGLAVADDPVLVALFAALAFGGGWGWAGLVLLAVARTNPTATGRAMGIVQVGPMSGAVVGPLAFGFIADGLGFGAAWAMVAGSALVGAIIVIQSGRMLAR